MLYYLFEYLENQYQLPGASLFGFLSFRAACTIILSLLISTIYGKRIIKFLNNKFKKGVLLKTPFQGWKTGFEPATSRTTI